MLVSAFPFGTSAVSSHLIPRTRLPPNSQRAKNQTDGSDHRLCGKTGLHITKLSRGRKGFQGDPKIERLHRQAAPPSPTSLVRPFFYCIEWLMTVLVERGGELVPLGTLASLQWTLPRLLVEQQTSFPGLGAGSSS